jgi:hypothetical protein
MRRASEHRSPIKPAMSYALFQDFINAGLVAQKSAEAKPAVKNHRITNQN